MPLKSPFDRPLSVCAGLAFALALLASATTTSAADSVVAPAATTQVENTASPDFTRICWNGDAQGQGTCTGSLVANANASPNQDAAVDWACTRDTLNKLVWSLRSVEAKPEEIGAQTYANAGHNTPARCGFGHGWRLPTRGELSGIVQQGRSAGPMIDSAYFPSTDKQIYWTTDTFRTDPGYAWGVLYGYDGSVAYYKTLPTHVRLVHSAE